MADLEIEVLESGDDQVTLRLQGTFDGRTAEMLRRSLLAVTPSKQDVVLDFSQVKSFVDLAVAVLTRDLALRPRLKLKGLGQHQERMFRYFGLAARDSALPAPYYRPEEQRLS